MLQFSDIIFMATVVHSEMCFGINSDLHLPDGPWKSQLGFIYVFCVNYVS